MSHLDSNTTPSFRRVDKPFGVETANNGIMKIDGEGKFKNLDSAFCGDAAASLLSVSQFTKSNNAAIVFTETDAFGVRCDDYVNSQFSNIKEHSSNSNQLLISATRDTDNLYEITDSQPYHLSYNRSLKPFYSSTLQPFLCGALKSLHDTSEDDVQPTFSVFQAPVNGEIREIRDFNANQDHSSTETTSDEVDSTILAWNPNTQLLQRHNIAMASYYQSAELPTLRDMVRFFS